MHDSKHFKQLNDEKHTRSSHALIDRALLKNMQIDINSASELIVSLREEKEKLRKTVLQLQQENHEKSSHIRSLKNRIRYMECIEEEDDVIKELSEANLKLKTEIEISLHGINPKASEQTSKIISLTEYFLKKTHDTHKHYQILKNIMKSSTTFKLVIGHEDWAQATFLLLRFYRELFNTDEQKATIPSTEPIIAEESDQESYSHLIQESKNLLDTLSYQKNKLENLNKEFSTRGHKATPNGSPIYRTNVTAEKITQSPDFLRKDSSQIVNFHTTSRIKNLPKYKTFSKK